MKTTDYLWIIMGMMAATFVSRYPMLYFAGRRTFPDRLSLVLRYIPPAVLVAIALPVVLIQDDELQPNLANEYLIASLVTALLVWRTGRMLLSIVSGMAALWLWRFLLAALVA